MPAAFGQHRAMGLQAKRSRRAVILTALDVEYDAIRAHVEVSTTKANRGSIYEIGTLKCDTTWSVLLIECGAGNDVAALEADRAIAFFDPNVVLFVGVAGGIKDVALGDVVVASEIYGYETAKETDVGLKPRSKNFVCAHALVQKARYTRRNSTWFSPDADSQTPRVIIAPIAAGEKVVASTRGAVANLLASNFSDAAAVEMEGRGALAAASANHTRATVIRGISDLLHGKSDSDRAGWQTIASKNAAAFASALLCGFDPSELNFDSQDGALKTAAAHSAVSDRFSVQRPPDHFTGRTEVLAAIKSCFIGRNDGCVCIAGAGGVGKTSLALQSLLGIDRPVVQFDGTRLADDLEIWRLMNGVGSEVETSDALRLCAPDTIFYVDNLSTASFSVFSEICKTRLVLFTARTRVPSLDIDFYFDLSSWTIAESQQYLYATCSRALDIPEDVLLSILSTIGTLPLAVRLFARYLDREFKPIAEIQKLLSDAPITALDTQASDTEVGLRRTFAISISLLSREERLMFAALAASADSPQLVILAITSGLDTPTILSLLNSLESSSLINCNVVGLGISWSMHQTLRLLATDLREYSEMCKNHDSRTLGLVRSLDDILDWPTIDLLIDDAAIAIERIISNGDALLAGAVAAKIIPHLRERGGRTALVVRLASAVSAHLSDSSNEYACMIGHLAIIDFQQGRSDDAERRLRTACSITKQNDFFESYYSNLGNLATVYKARGDLDSAAALYTEAIDYFSGHGFAQRSAHLHLNRGMLELTRGNRAAGFDDLKSSIELSLGVEPATTGTAYLAATQHLTGERFFIRASFMGKQALTHLQRAGRPHECCMVAILLVHVFINLNQPEQALLAITPAVALSDQYEDVHVRAQVREAAAIAHGASDEILLAIDSLELGLKLVAKSRDPRATDLSIRLRAMLSKARRHSETDAASTTTASM